MGARYPCISPKPHAPDLLFKARYSFHPRRARIANHTVEFEVFVGSELRASRDQIRTTQGPDFDCSRQVDF